jgi:GNAT superfamily N-acetyltransferase
MQDIEQALEVCKVNEPSMTAGDKAATLAHWLTMYANCPEGFWIAEDEASRQIVGVASAVRRPPQWILANFYVLPVYQGKGIGRKLLSQAYSTREGCDRFLVHASAHSSAQVLYLKLGMVPLPYSIMFKGTRNQSAIPTVLKIEKYPLDEIISTLNNLDQRALGFTRAAYHHWWGRSGSYYLAKQEGQTKGYFRVSPEGMIGPLVVSDEQWMAAALDCAIYQQNELDVEKQEIFVPGANRAAIAHLFTRGYRFHELHLLLSSHPMPGLAQVIFHDTDLL